MRTILIVLLVDAIVCGILYVGLSLTPYFDDERRQERLLGLVLIIFLLLAVGLSLLLVK